MILTHPYDYDGKWRKPIENHTFQIAAQHIQCRIIIIFWFCVCAHTSCCFVWGTFCVWESVSRVLSVWWYIQYMFSVFLCEALSMLFLSFPCSTFPSFIFLPLEILNMVFLCNFLIVQIWGVKRRETVWERIESTEEVVVVERGEAEIDSWSIYPKTPKQIFCEPEQSDLEPDFPQVVGSLSWVFAV